MPNSLVTGVFLCKQKTAILVNSLPTPVIFIFPLFFYLFLILRYYYYKQGNFGIFRFWLAPEVVRVSTAFYTGKLPETAC